MIEVEFKFALPAQSRMLLQTRLAGLPFVRCLAYHSNIDSYYDTRSSECLRQDVFIRIRNHRYLEIKFHEQADPTHTHCSERLFPLQAEPSDVQEMNALCARFVAGWQEASTIEGALRANGLREFAHIEMLRTCYVCEDMTLCIDDVEGLGDFFEIETSCEELGQVEQAEARLHRFVSDLGLPSLQRVQSGYVELWLSVYQPQMYQWCTHQDKRAENAVLSGGASVSATRH